MALEFQCRTKAIALIRPPVNLEQLCKPTQNGISRQGRHSKKSKYIRAGDSVTRAKVWEYDMTGHAASAVEKYLELTGKSEHDLKQFANPCIDDHMLSDEDFEKRRIKPKSS